VLLGLHLTSSLDKSMFKMTRSLSGRIGTFVLSFSLIFAAVLSTITVKTMLGYYFYGKFLIAAISPNPPMDKKVLLY